ncbi:hypothetical protein [Acinetobacter sp. TUM15051]|uniref:hypothetical protein n=1 Tax=Acinetobacter sp. TUM15051 TaxID=2609132 RepID=UPI00124E9913|nr:hypothetical protein [Acinetobacter sp. TUM15051]
MDKKALLEQFEALPLMVAILNDSFIYVDQTNEYAHPNLEDNRVTLGYVNGAWYAFQHQQAKVEELQKQKSLQELEVNQIAQANQVWQSKFQEMKKRADALTQTMEELLEEMKYPTATFEEVIVCSVKALEQALKGEGK